MRENIVRRTFIKLWNSKNFISQWNRTKKASLPLALAPQKRDPRSTPYNKMIL